MGVLAASQSANIIRIGDAPALAIAFWRLFLATILMAPFALKAGGLRGLAVRERCFLVLAGIVLALHFVTWIGAVQNTTVANASLILAIAPVLTAIFGFWFLKERPSSRLIASIAAGLLGMAIIGGTDLHLKPQNLLGDGLAVLSASVMSAYTLLGRRLRPHLPASTYAVSIYAVAAFVCLLGLLLSSAPLLDYSLKNWVCFSLMALIPTGIGHTSINYALRYIPAAKISTMVLVEPFFAGLVAFWVWDENVHVLAVVGYALILLATVWLFSERPKNSDALPAKIMARELT